MESRPAFVNYLRAAASQPFAWGKLDCSLFMAGWVLARTGIDPAAPLRGRYSTERGALRLARRQGGMEAVARRQMTAAGFATTCKPVPGDVGIIAHRHLGPTCAILSEIGWLMKTPAGVSGGGNYPVIVAWSLP